MDRLTDFQRQVQDAIGPSYRILSELGGGGMSRVFLAEEVQVERKVVVKVLPPETSAAVSVERFEREIRLAARLQHPHIVPFLTTGGKGDLLFYIMPFIEGESLRAKLAREGELPIPEAVRILRDVADALAMAHKQGIVHRDIKPDNILLSGRHALVTDFGVAKAVEKSSGSGKLTSLGVALGTPAYMSPEQATADPHTDHRADLYALGIVAYEMLCGRQPFEASSAQGLIAAHVTQQPQPVERFRNNVPPALAALIMRCLEKKPADRPQTAEELVQAVEAMGTPTSTTPGGMTPAGTAPYPAAAVADTSHHGHPVRVAVLFGLAAAVVLAVTWALTVKVGLPSWVVPGVGVLLALGFPVMMATGLAERRRATSRAQLTHTPKPESGVRGLLTWRRALLGGGLAFGALALLAGGYMAMRVLGVGSVGTLMATGALESKSPLVLADFANRTSDAALGPSVTDAFRVDLSQSPVIRLLDAAAVRAALTRMGMSPDAPLDDATARELAQRENAKAFITGEIGSVGSGYVLSTRIVATADGHELVALRETAADESEVIPAIDRLSKRLRERVGESLKSLNNTEKLELVSTSSLEALKKYSQAVRLDDNGGDPALAAQLLQEAVAADSTFAMAWRKLSVVSRRASLPMSLSLEAGQKAYDLRDRLTPLERQLAISTYYSANQPDFDKQIAAHKAALEIDPNDRTSLNNLALAYRDIGRYEDAEAVARRAVEVDHSWFAYGHLAFALTAQGRFAEADSALQELDRVTPGQPRGVIMQAALRSAQGDYAGADSVLRGLIKARSERAYLFQATVDRVNIAVTEGRVTEAINWLSDLVDVATRDGNLLQVYGVTIGMANLDYTGRPRPKADLSAVERLLAEHPLDSLAPADRPYGGLAMLYAAAGQPEQARRYLALDQKFQPREWNPPLGRSRFVEAKVLESEGKYPEALAAYQDATRMPRNGEYCRECGDFYVGRVFDRMNQPDSALTAYNRAVNTPMLNRNAGEAGVLGPTLRRMGELYEARGERDKAKDYYSRFVALWRDADSDLQPAVQDVKARLAQLAAEPKP
ncbi:MAG TPA: protein kinase [Gemmatimonadales bacterium]|nr:protein kinase [Gemmatimonadales bacterium]